MSRALFLFTLALGLVHSVSEAADPEASPAVVERGVGELFESRFDGKDTGAIAAALLKNYRVTMPGGFELGSGKLILKGPYTLVRPINAGPIARLKAELLPRNASDKSATFTSRLRLLIATRQMASLTIRRDIDGGEARLAIHSQDGSEKVLRTVKLAQADTAGTWELAYHHGYLRSLRDGKLNAQAVADINPSAAPIIGIAFEQLEGEISLASLRLSGLLNAAAALSPDQLEARRQAQQVTSRAAKLFADGNLDEAAEAAQESLVLWRKATGQSSADAANAAFNLATVMLKKADVEQTAAAFSIVVDARRESLGAGHPLTARAMVDLARIQVIQNRSAEARSLATAAAEVLMAAYGESHPFVSDAKKLAAP